MHEKVGENRQSFKVPVMADLVFVLDFLDCVDVVNVGWEH